MATLFEYCFYAGLVLGLIALVWLVVSLLRKPRRLVPPLFLLMLGFVLLVGPALISRTMSVSLGKIERVVDEELHLSLTGWDGESYAFLQTKPDTIVLQMGNADVTDDTLSLLANMSRLRELDLNDSSITAVGLPILAKLPSLETLRLRGTKITYRGALDTGVKVPRFLENIGLSKIVPRSMSGPIGEAAKRAGKPVRATTD